MLETATHVTVSLEGRPANEAALVLQYLLRHPGEFDLLLWLARDDKDAQRPAWSDPAGTESTQRLRLFLGGSFFGICPKCYLPTIVLIDGRLLDWPGVCEHECDMNRAQSIARPATTQRQGIL